jgi:Ca2+-binding EF-hand superfamily protein
MKLLIKFIPIEKGINVQYMKYSFNYFDQDENGKISYE